MEQDPAKNQEGYTHLGDNAWKLELDAVGKKQHSWDSEG